MKKLGIWIDSEKAVFIEISDDEKTNIITLFSDVEGRIRDEGQGRSGSKFGNIYFDDERKKEHRHDHQIKRFIDDVIKQLKDCKELVIFGPAETKKLLGKTIDEHPNLSGISKQVVTADNMTDKQLAAWVKNHFKV